MQVIHARSVGEALHQGLHTLRVHGVAKPSRVGDVLVSPRPIMTVYSNPENRVLFSPMRDANPFFHVMEALWMLAGRNDLPWLTKFNKRFAAYSDDGGLTQPGAYGYRWREHFGHDQLQDVILELKQNPDSRRVVLSMWDSGSRADWLRSQSHDNDDAQPGDFFSAISGSADVPCNTHAYFDTIDGKLNMTVCCRSNDIIWGAYGANAVHFSFLLEYLAAMVGIPMGVYRQFSNNYHLYTNVVARENLMPMARDVENSDRYLVAESRNSMVKSFTSIRKIPLVTDPETFEAELHDFMEGDFQNDATCGFTNSFFPFVAIPMYQAHELYREKKYDAAMDIAEGIRAEDWRQVCVQWIERRKIRAETNAKPFTEVVGEGATMEVDETAEAFGLERRKDA